MNRLARKFLHFVFLILALLPLQACATDVPLLYSAKEIRGQIVDAETNQPLEGVVIVAQWILFQAGIGHGGHNQRLYIYEAVTDANGNYVIPAWGPKSHPPFTELDRLDPELSIFKSGYKPAGFANSQDRNDSVRISEWDGKVIKLEKNKEDIETYARKLRILSSGLPHDSDEWKSFPRMILALEAEDKHLRSLGLKDKYRATIFDPRYFSDADREFLKGFEK